MLSRLARADVPVVAAVNGAAAGAGMGLACACDLVIAAESARFTMAYTKVGLSPDGSTTYFLPCRVGIGRALELALLNRTLDAEEAREWGIVNRVVGDDALPAEAHEVARSRGWPDPDGRGDGAVTPGRRDGVETITGKRSVWIALNSIALVVRLQRSPLFTPSLPRHHRRPALSRARFHATAPYEKTDRQLTAKTLDSGGQQRTQQNVNA